MAESKGLTSRELGVLLLLPKSSGAASAGWTLIWFWVWISSGCAGMLCVVVGMGALVVRLVLGRRVVVVVVVVFVVVMVGFLVVVVVVRGVLEIVVLLGVVLDVAAGGAAVGGGVSCMLPRSTKGS